MRRRPRSRVPHRSVVRPTGRGAIALVLAPLFLIGAEVTGLTQLRYLASALIIALALSLLAILLTGAGLGLQRRVLSDAVPAGQAVDVQLALAPGALLARLPLGRGVVRSYLPDALGGHGDLALAPQMPHSLLVQRRGVHELGWCAILVRDVLGLFHRRRMIDAPAHVTGLPAVEDVDVVLARRLGRAVGELSLLGHRAQGEPGPIARPYVPGDDIRRMHWKASARTGRLMTREDEPSTSVNALIVLDTRAPEGPLEAAQEEALVRAQDRVVDHAATALLALRAQGFDVTVLDASGDRIVSAAREHPLQPGGAVGVSSPRGPQADVLAARTALLALAELGFGDADRMPAADQGSPGPVAVALALGVGNGEAFEDVDLDRFAGSAPRRLALAIRPDGAAAPAREHGHRHRAEGEDPVGGPLGPGAQGIVVRGAAGRGSWRLVEAGCAASLSEILQALETADGAR